MGQKKVAANPKKAAKKTAKKKAAGVKKVVLRQELSLPLEPVPVLREALICAIDDPKRWGSKGSPSEGYDPNDLKTMYVIAEKAADLCRGDRCFFCGGKQEPTPPEDVHRLHLGVPMCPCHVPFRKMAYDHLENWATPEGGKGLLDLLNAGKLGLNTPVYQYFCTSCGTGPVIVDARTVAFGLRKHGKHNRRRKCNACFLKLSKRVVTAPASEGISRPKHGPTAKINKIKPPKHKGPTEKSLPPLEAILSDQQLDEKGLESLKAQQ